MGPMRRIHSRPLLAAQVVLVGCLERGLLPRPPGDAGAAGAPITLLSPPAGTPAPTNLARLVVASERHGELSLVDPSGRAVALAPDDAGACGRQAPVCLSRRVAESLSPEVVYQVVAGDERTSFATGTAPDTLAPEGRVSALTSDGCTVFRLLAAEPVWAELVGDDGRVAVGDGLARNHELAVDFRQLSEEGVRSARVELVDGADNRASIPLGDLAWVPRSSWALSEVLANPAGPEPEEEWVELVRLAADPGTLDGLRISDGSGQDALPDLVVSPGERVLVVPQGYSEIDGSDVAPAPGTRLARIEGATLGEGGLANTGETVFLLDASGTPLSAFTPGANMSSASWAGRSVERRRLDACDVAANVAPNAGHAATPGARNSVEQ